MLNLSMHYKYCVDVIYDDGAKMLYTEILSSDRLTYREVYMRVKVLHPECFKLSVSAFNYREEVYLD